MLVSYQWLKELVDVEVSTAELAEKMSTTGIEVEGVTSPADGLSKLVVGAVVSCEAVPDTHLHLCQVDTGEGELRQIVCGAPNIKAGIKVIVALPGARIAGNYKIKKGKIRGLESLGMICSLQELGVPDAVIPKDSADGIQYLPDKAVPGDSVFSYLDLDDAIIELSITPNRADALSMRGVAHEVAAIYGKTVHFPEKSLTESAKPAAEVIEVGIDSEQVLTYAARVVENVTIAPSPQWLQNRLRNAGIRPINNVVDVTNLVLLYFGQPMHAFDLDKFDGRTILARNARSGEKLVTLDGEERELETEDIVITVNDQPVALGGVMGGAATEIDSSSRNVVLEAAVFDSRAVRKSSSRLGLRSESSSRFEKGINYTTVTEALDYAAALLTELAGGQVLNGRVQAGSLPTEPVTVSTSLDYVNVRLGTKLTYADIERIFAQLGFGLTGQAEHFTVSVPRRRWDITIQADLVEEIARIYGYDKLPTTLPQEAGTLGELTPMQKLRRQVRTLAEGAGLTEVISYALTTPEKAVAFSPNPTAVTELLWPMTEDRSALRQNMVSGLLDIVAYNSARKNTDLAIYEIGKIFEQTGDVKQDLPQEIESFAFALTGQAADGSQTDFFTAKGILEAVFDQLRLPVRFEAYQGLTQLHPGRAALMRLDGEPIGFVGQVHPALAQEQDLPETYVAEISLTALAARSTPAAPFQDISKYPAVSRDMALLLPAETSHQVVLDAISAAGIKRLTAVKLFDVYQGANIQPGKKSMAYSLTFQNPEASLTDEEVSRYMDKISRSLADELGAEVR